MTGSRAPVLSHYVHPETALRSVFCSGSHPMRGKRAGLFNMSTALRNSLRQDLRPRRLSTVSMDSPFRSASAAPHTCNWRIETRRPVRDDCCATSRRRSPLVIGTGFSCRFPVTKIGSDSPRVPQTLPMSFSRMIVETGRAKASTSRCRCPDDVTAEMTARLT